LTILAILAKIYVTMPNLHPITSTELKNSTANILNTVYYNKVRYTIKRHGKPIAILEPITKTKEKPTLKAALVNSFGSLPDFPDVTKTRFFRSRNTTL